MANIDRIINVQISLNTAGITSQGFNTMLIAGWHGYSTERVMTITDANELLEMGFKADNPIYCAAADAFSQTPHVREVKIGRMQCDTVRLGFNGDVIAGNIYSLQANSVDAKGEIVAEVSMYTSQEADTVADVLAGLADGLKDSVVYIASVVENELYIKSADPTHSFAVVPMSPLVINSFVPADISIAENMANIAGADTDFYGIILASRKQDDILAMADWAETQTKLFVTAIAEVGAKNAEVTADTGALLMEGNYYRTAWYYHADAETDFPDAAIMSRCFTVLPGGETWANKRLSAVTTDVLKEHEYKAIIGKNGNTFEKFRNISITQNGKVAAGEWIDVIRFRDWLVETIQTEEFTMLINRDKLPYTDSGIALVESTLNSVLALGQRRGGIAPVEYDEEGNKNTGYVITVPKASSISANVKAQRVLRDVTFTARLAGAIHVVEITGSLTYENLLVSE